MTTGQKYSCQGCSRDDLTLTRNGKVRSHAADGKRVGKDNPACGMGSEYPLQSTEFHTHTFTYADDQNGHSGSYCACGLVEGEDEAPAAAPVPPNPFRDPAPGGVWDVTGVPDRGLPADRQFRGPAVSHHSDLADALERPAPRPAGPTSADDFLDGSDDDLGGEEESDEGRRYFPSRYDGTCITCLAHFDEGDMITRGPDDDGWEAQDCCGKGAAPRPEVPKAVARTLPVVRGRYKLPDPETGKPLSASRASKFAEGIADSYSLDQWRHRMILAGLVNDPSILEKVASAMRDKEPLDVVKQEREFLNKRADEAMTAAGGDIRSGQGTKLHKYTEEIDGGTRTLAQVPEDYRPDAEAYVIALAACGFRPVVGLIERSVFCRELKVCGTFDRVLECIHDTDVVDLYGRPVQIHAGEFVIGDVKSGDNIKHPWLEIQIQESIYAHAVNENGVAVQDRAGGPFRWVTLAEMGAAQVREDVGIVMHVPFGQGAAKLYFADLILGWRGAKICQQNREFWKIQLPHVPVAEFVVGQAPDDMDPDTLVTRPDLEVPPTAPDTPFVGFIPVNDTETDDSITCFCGEKWDNIETANAYDHDYKSCGPDEEAVNGSELDPTVPDPEPPANNIMEAVHRAKHAAQREVTKIVMDASGKSATVYRGEPEPVGTSKDQWTERFRAAKTREEANKLWREAKDAGVDAMDLRIMVSMVQLDRTDQEQTAVSRPPEPSPVPVVAEAPDRPQTATGGQDGPTLTEQAHAVTDKAQASKIFREMTAKINDLPEEKRAAAREYRDKLVKIMQDRLKAA
jgi:hypothetical protein